MNKRILPLVAFLLLVFVGLSALKWGKADRFRGQALSPTPLAEQTFFLPPTEPTPSQTKAPDLPTPSPEMTPVEMAEKGTTVGNFTLTENLVCLEEDRPIIYFFGSNNCPHCQWQHPILDRVTQKFSGLISYHNNMDSTNDGEVFYKYNDFHGGYIPFLVIGCKYVRLGSGENFGEVAEEENLTALICKLTGSRPDAICSPLINLINEVK